MAYYGKSLESARLMAYVRRYGIREAGILRQCRLETLKRPEYGIMIMPEEAAFLAFFISLMGFKRGLEVGVYTGYSSLAMALAMPEDSELVCCELEAEYLRIARGYWEKAGVAQRVTSHEGPGLDSLEQMLAKGEENSFDFAFVDANKDQYDDYYEACLKLVRPSGVIILDNMLWDGKVMDKTDDSEWTSAIRALNEKLHADERVELTMTTIGDGTTFIRKR